MATNMFNKIFGIKRSIWSSDGFYAQNSDTQEQYRLDIAEAEECSPEDLTDELLADFWYQDNECNYEAE